MEIKHKTSPFISPLGFTITPALSAEAYKTCYKLSKSNDFRAWEVENITIDTHSTQIANFYANYITSGYMLQLEEYIYRVQMEQM